MVDKGPRPEHSRRRFREIEVLERAIGLAMIAKNHPNQDTVFVARHKGRFAVLDGVGGETGGARASQTVRESFGRSVQQPPTSENDVTENLTGMLLNANILLRSGDRHGFTTATIAQIIEVDGQKKVVFCNLGDSRGYIWKSGFWRRRSKRLNQATIDNDIVHRALSPRAAERVAEKLDNIKTTDELQRDPKPIRFKQRIDAFPLYHPVTDEPFFEPRESATLEEFFAARNYIDSVLGKKIIKPTLSTRDVKSGDLIILTSDGVHDNLTPREINNIIAINKKDPQAVAQKLADEARRISQQERTDYNRRPKTDDITALVIKIP